MRTLLTFIGALLGSLLLLAWLAFYLLCLAATGYVAYEILFDNALNRWFT